VSDLGRDWYSKPEDWSDWYDGSRYNVRTGHTSCLDKSCLRSRVEVEIYDTETGKYHYRIGEGTHHGEDYIIDIWWRGVTLSLGEMLEIEF
jgi:hypothetical protein